jgi:hypothetical protein
MPLAFALLSLAGVNLGALGAAGAAQAQQSPVEIAQGLENPIYDRVTIPLQNNYDCCFSPETGYKYTLNIEPVIPVARIGDVEVISRTIFPIIYEFHNNPGQGGHTGAGDTTQAFYFGQEFGKAFYYGAGPIVLIPSYDSQLSSGKWAMGPTFALGGRSGRFTASFLFWQYWSFAGEASAAPVSKTRLQPQIAYTFGDATTLRVGADADYDWIKRSWNAPFHAGAAHVFRVRGHDVQLALEGRVFTATAKGPQAGVRFTATWVYPR